MPVPGIPTGAVWRPDVLKETPPPRPPGLTHVPSGGAAMVGQSAVYVTASVVTGVAFGAILLASAPAIVATFALPTAWAALATIPAFTSVGNPHANETVAGALARLTHRRRRRTGDREQ